MLATEQDKNGVRTYPMGAINILGGNIPNTAQAAVEAGVAG